ncbi:pentalenolactone synthase [Crossiella equi]|uniref:Pentalenolactone synthase n=1 Tax=Crossiella equi TaxID=130796 RepID=A0ABS5A9E8_9PSEU|nr:cytochrome P450 [Crossiella equi]MBP2472360.1 pentalenolactone synthase [Crossiella equi]
MTTTERPVLPFPRANVLEIAPLYRVLRRQGPLARVTSPAGDPAWLVTRHAEAKRIFGDKRFGRSHPDPANAPRVSDAAVLSAPEGDFETEQAQHAFLRALLMPAFSAGRMRKLSGRVRELTEQCLDAMRAEADRNPGMPVDLHEHLSFPLPVLVICELLGVPYEDRHHFRDLSERIGMIHGGEDTMAAMADFVGYLASLAERKRREPGEDVVSDMVRAQAQTPGFGDQQLAEVAVALLFAGHETTVNRIDVGVLLLLADPDRRDAFAADPEGQAKGTVEEVLRIATPEALGTLRYAREDVDLDGVLVGKGDAVIISLAAANRDEDVFADPDAFDPHRSPNPHLAFGHGGFFCLGATLARVEMQVALSCLFTRFPRLRLAVPVDGLRLQHERLLGGVDEVPVLW